MGIRCIILAVALWLVPCVSAGETVTYTNTHRGFSLEIPKDWTRIEESRNDSEATWLTRENIETGTVFSARTVTVPKPTDLKTFEELSLSSNNEMQRLTHMSDYKEVARRDAKLGALNARISDYMATIDGLPVRGSLCVALGGNRGFLFGIESRQPNLNGINAAFLAVLGSFKSFAPDGKDGNYSSTRFGYSLTYPAAWTALDVAPGRMVLLAPFNGDKGGFTANIVIVTEKGAGYAEPKEIKEIVMQAYTEFKAMPGMSVQGALKKARIGNLDAYVYTLIRSLPGAPKVQVEAYSAGFERRLFNVNCAARADSFAETRKTFETILKSLRVESMPPRWEEYKSAVNGFAVKYRDDWMLIEPTKDSAGFGLKKKIEGVEFPFEAMITVSMDSIDSNEDLDSRAERSKRWIEKQPGHVFAGQKPAKVAGLDAIEQEYTFKLEDKIPMKGVRYEIVSRHRNHEVELWAPTEKFTSYLPVFEAFLKSFTILKSADAFIMYRSRATGLEFLVPEAWKVYEQGNKPMLAVMLESETKKADGTADIVASLVIRPEEIDPEMTLEKYAEAKLAQARDEARGVKADEKIEMKVEKKSEVTIGEDKAIKYTLSGAPKGEERIMTDAYAVIAGGKGWIITAPWTEARYKKHSKTIDAMIASIKFPEHVILAPPLPKTEITPEGMKEWNTFVSAFHAIRDYLAKGEILIPSDILAKAELSDHFETINLDRPDKGNAFGNPDSRWFPNVTGNDGPEDPCGSFGFRDGGGRRLRVTKRCADLSTAILECARAGYVTKVKETPTKEQSAELARHTETLGSTDVKKREAAADALLTAGMPAVNLLIDALNATKDDGRQTQILELLQKIQLRATVDKFRAAHPVKSEAVSPKK